MNKYNPNDPSIPKLKVAEMTETFGGTGTEVYSGYFDTDRVVDWNDPYTRSKIVNKMRREYVAVQSALNILYAPILSTSWQVEGGDEEQRKWLQEQFFGLTQRTWQELLQEILTHLPFGFAVFEIIYKVGEDGKVGLFDLAPRIQESIEKFEMSDGGAGIQQRLQGDFMKAYADVPMDKLIIFTNNKEGDDLMGVSVIRAARMHTVFIDRLYKVQGIAADRYGVGIPIVTYPETGGDKEKKVAEDLGKNMKSNEQSYVAKKEGWTVDILTPKGNPLGTSIENGIAHHNRQILMSCLAHGLDTGSTGTGSLALSKTQQFDRLSFAEQKATYVKDQLNKLAKKLIDLNWGKQEEYPILTYSALGVEDDLQMADVYKKLHEIGAVNNDPEMINYIRRAFGIPELTEEQIEEILINKEYAIERERTVNQEVNDSTEQKPV